MTTEYKAALDAFDDKNTTEEDIFANHEQTIRRALLIADRLMQEPSDGMIGIGIDADDARTGYQTCRHIFKAMRDQLIKEAEGE
jgi:hypothetical protein